MLDRVKQSLGLRLIGIVVAALLLQGLLTFAVVTFNLHQFTSENAKANRDFIHKKEREKLKGHVQLSYEVIQSYYNRSQDVERLKQEKQEELKKVVEAVFNQVETFYQSNRLLLTDAELEAGIQQLVKSARFDNGNYIWINDMHPRMVMHPVKSELDGKDLSNFKDPEGNRLFVDMVKVCRNAGEGVVSYMWPKPGETVSKPKISYVKLFKPLNWILGSGAWIEDIVAEMKEEALTQVAKMRLPNGNYFWVNDMHPRMIMHPTVPSLNGKDLSDYQDKKGKRLFVEMARECRQNGQGFVDYWWTKPGEDPDELFPKESFVKLFEPWGWVVGMGVYLDEVDAVVTEQTNRFRSAIFDVSLQTGIFVTVFLIIVIGLLVWFFRSNLSNPLGRLVAFSGEVAQGRLDVDLKGRFPGEIGKLKTSIETMVDSLKSMMREAKVQGENARKDAEAANRFRSEAEEAQRQAESAKREGLLHAADLIEDVVSGLGALSEELNAQIQQVTQGAELQRSRSSETATAMEEMNATVLEVARNASNASEGADSARSKALEGAEVVRKSVSANSRVNSLANELSNTMHDLGEQTESIGQIMNVISDIADQTNLLALNAAIEAARAGDAGRGFAVVADEVRKLAEKTMTATKEVGDAIKSIQSGTQRNIQSVEEATSAVEEATSLANESGRSLEEILELVQSTSDQVRGIATASEEQSAASEEINRAVDDVSRVSNETAEGMHTAERLLTELVELTAKLKELTEELRHG